MDFWAQHKDFVLKVAAGFGVFLVALIARGIVYGDELELAQRKNSKLSGDVKRMRIANIRDIQGLEGDAKALEKNAGTIVGQIGWKGTVEDLDSKLIERTLGYLRKYREDPGQLKPAAAQARQAILDNLNGGFGQLRLTVEDDLADECAADNIRVEDGFGFQNVTELQSGELEKYLIQLELATRVVRYCIDAKVAGIEEVRIDTKGGLPIAGANPDFLREFAVRVRFRGEQGAVLKVLERLASESPAAPLRGLRMDRSTRPRDHLLVEVSVLAVAATVDGTVPFVKEGEQ